MVREDVVLRAPTQDPVHQVEAAVARAADAGVVTLAPWVVLHAPQADGGSARWVEGVVQEEVAGFDVNGVGRSAGKHCGDGCEEDVLILLVG